VDLSAFRQDDSNVRRTRSFADGAPKDEKVTIYELKSYLDDRVPAYSREHKGKTQFPYTFSKGRDFPITIVK